MRHFCVVREHRTGPGFASPASLKRSGRCIARRATRGSAELLLDLVQRSLPDARVARFSFRAAIPLFDTAPFVVCGAPEPDDAKSIRLWAQEERGGLATEARVVLA